MLSDWTSKRITWDIIECIISEEIIPKNESRRYWRTFKIVVPLLQESDNLITLFSDIFFREEQKFSLSIDVDENLLSFFDKWICINSWSIIKQAFKSKSVSACCQFSTSLNQKLFFGWVHHFLLKVAGLVFGCQVSVRNNQKVSFEIRNPSFFAQLRSSREIRI